jgi:hypothetical protein
VSGYLDGINRLRRKINARTAGWILVAALAVEFPIAMPAGAQRWESVSVGSDHACAVDVNGRAYCWDYNHAAQLGAAIRVQCGVVGESGQRSCYPVPSETEPLAVGGSTRFASVSAGEYVTCGLDRAAKAYCWGSAMGDSTGYADRCLEQRPCSFAPVPLVPERAFTALNMDYRCGIGAGGEAVCWLNPASPREKLASGWPGLRVAAVDGDPGTENACAVLRDGRIIAAVRARSGCGAAACAICCRAPLPWTAASGSSRWWWRTTGRAR